MTGRDNCPECGTPPEAHHFDDCSRKRIPALEDQIRLLPELEATKSRDYGRGYAEAIKDVLDILAASTLVRPGMTRNQLAELAVDAWCLNYDPEGADPVGTAMHAALDAVLEGPTP